MNRVRAFLERHLDPSEQMGEVLFGLIMVLMFTLGAGATVEEGRDATRTLLLSVLGCNIAWGVINGGMFIVNSMFERGRNARLIRAVQQSADEEQALTVIRDELDADLEELASAEERSRLYRDILGKTKNAEPAKTRVKQDDFLGAIAVFALVVLTTVPAIVPFLFLGDLRVALRVSNLLLVTMLFLVGYRWGRLTNTNPWLAGLVMLLVGIAMVGVAEALGG